LLLDRQTPQVAAAWWAETFLNAILIVDGKVGATGFNDANHNAYLRLIKTGKTAAADAVKEQGRIELGNRRLRRSAYLARLPQDARDIVDEELEKRFAGTKTIPIDVEFASENLTKKTRFRGKYGVVFEVETKNYDKVVREKTTFTDADNTEITRFVLEIPELQQMK
jgi:ribosomal protein L21E